MCGIAGYFSVQRRYDLASAILALRHRGPDGYGVFQDEDVGVGLAHVRLSIIDLSETGSQPMQTEDGSLVLSYNGEIYNYPELRVELEAEGHIFHGTSDTEVLLRLLQGVGLDALPRLNGMFAFAYFNRKDQSLAIVRDAYGVKPLYYSENERGTFFSSEIRALEAMDIELTDPDPVLAARHLAFLWNPGPETISNNIKRLGPGEALTIKSGKITKHWKWFTQPSLAPKIIKRSNKDAAKALTGYLRAAVNRQLIADVQVGAFLSGGLDSSAIVALARESVPDIRCFTIEAAGGAEKGTTDDLPYAKQVANHLKVPLDVVKVDEDTMAGDLAFLVEQLEEPVADPACLNVYYISKLARDQGIKVLLSGAGGDDLLTGYRRHRALSFGMGLDRFPASVRQLLACLGGLLPVDHSLLRRTAKFSQGLSLDGDERLLNYFLWTRREDVLSLLSPDAAAALNQRSIVAPLAEYLKEIAIDVDPIDRMLALEQRFFLAEHNLLYTDKMSMAASVEVRVPFLDLEFAAFSATLDPRIKQKGSQGKWIFKKAMEPYLPRTVIYRPKTGFGVPLRRWLSTGLSELKNDLLSDDAVRRRGLFDPVAVRKLQTLDRDGMVDGSYTILALMCIELWCRSRRGFAPYPG